MRVVLMGMAVAAVLTAPAMAATEEDINFAAEVVTALAPEADMSGWSPAAKEAMGGAVLLQAGNFPCDVSLGDFRAVTNAKENLFEKASQEVGPRAASAVFDVWQKSVIMSLFSSPGKKIAYCRVFNNEAVK